MGDLFKTIHVVGTLASVHPYVCLTLCYGLNRVFLPNSYVEGLTTPSRPHITEWPFLEIGPL